MKKPLNCLLISNKDAQQMYFMKSVLNNNTITKTSVLSVHLITHQTKVV